MTFFKLKLVTLDGFGLLRCAALLAVIAGCQLSFAQQDNSDPEVEEIVVTGERSLQAMRLQVQNAQSAVFDVYNETYAGTEYEISCKFEKPATGGDGAINSGYIRNCGTPIVRAAQNDAWDAYMEELEGFAAMDEAYHEQVFEESKAVLNQKIAELAGENPEFQEKMSQYIRIKASYDAAVQADFEEDNFFTRLFQ